MDICTALREEQQVRLPGRIYHWLQVEFAYQENQLAGSSLSMQQVRSVYETRTIVAEQPVQVNDILAALNQFRGVDLIVKQALRPLTADLVRNLEMVLKVDIRPVSGMAVTATGGRVQRKNKDGAIPPTGVLAAEIAELLKAYECSSPSKSIEDLLRFHVKFLQLQPPVGCGGRVARLILFKECLRHSIVPFLVTEQHKRSYQEGIQVWGEQPARLLAIARAEQETMVATLNRFGIEP